MLSTPSLLSHPYPHCPGVVPPDRVLSMGQIELNCVLMLNWNVGNRTVFYIEIVYLCKTKLIEIELFLILNWIVWNRTVFYIEIVYLCKTKLIEIELFLILNWIVWNRTVFDVETVYLC